MTLGEVLTPAELVRVATIKETMPCYLWAKKIDAEVTGPALARINKIIGQENCPRFWAYIIIHATR